MIFRNEKRGRPLTRGAQRPGTTEIKHSVTRKFLVSAAFGETGVGKSHQTDIEIANYIRGFNGNQCGRKVLIIDTNGEYIKYPTITLHHLKDFNNNTCYRINLRSKSVEEKKYTALKAVQLFNNGLLIMDDIDSYEAYSRDQHLISSLMGNRHKNLDLLLIHQSLDMGTPNFYRNATALRLHRQQSQDRILMTKAKDKFPILKIAQIIIEEQYISGNIHFFLVIMLRDQKIRGCSSRKEFNKAVMMYLNQYASEIKAEIGRITTLNPELYKKRNDSSVRTLAINNLIDRYGRFLN